MQGRSRVRRGFPILVVGDVSRDGLAGRLGFEQAEDCRTHARTHKNDKGHSLVINHQLTDAKSLTKRLNASANWSV